MMHKGAQKPGWPSADDGVFLGNRITHLRLRESAPLQSFLGLPFGRDFNGLFHFGKPFIKLKQSPSARPVCWMLNVGDVRPLTAYQNGEAANEVVCSSLTVVSDMPLHLACCLPVLAQIFPVPTKIYGTDPSHFLRWYFCASFRDGKEM